MCTEASIFCRRQNSQNIIGFGSFLYIFLLGCWMRVAVSFSHRPVEWKHQRKALYTPSSVHTVPGTAGTSGKWGAGHFLLHCEPSPALKREQKWTCDVSFTIVYLSSIKLSMTNTVFSATARKHGVHAKTCLYQRYSNSLNYTKSYPAYMHNSCLMQTKILSQVS